MVDVEGVRDPEEVEGWETGNAGEGGTCRGRYTPALGAEPWTSTKRCNVPFFYRRGLAVAVARWGTQKKCAEAKFSSRTNFANAAAKQGT